MELIPKEFSLGGVYLPPWLIASLFGIIAAWISAALLNRLRLSRWFAYPPLVYLAMAVLYTVGFGTWVIPA
jgi:hypothetical protein